MKAGVFKLNMHPKEYFDRNPFREEGKGGKRSSEEKERSRSAPSDKKPFKYSSPGKSVSPFASTKSDHNQKFVLVGWKQRRLFR